MPFNDLFHNISQSFDRSVQMTRNNESRINKEHFLIAMVTDVVEFHFNTFLQIPVQQISSDSSESHLRGSPFLI